MKMYGNRTFPATTEIEAESFLSGLGKQIYKTFEDLLSIKQYYFVKFCEKICIFLSVIFAIAAGICPPIMIVVFSHLLHQFIIFTMSQKALSPENEDQDLNLFVSMKWIDIDDLDYPSKMLDHVAYIFAIKTMILGAVMFSCITLFVLLLNRATSTMVRNARSAYFKSILSHEMAWFDLQDPIDIAANLIRDPNIMEEGLGEKMGFLIMNFTTSFVAILIAFYSSFYTAFILTFALPIVYLLKWIRYKVQHRLGSIQDVEYFKAELSIQDTFSKLHIVKVYNNEDFEYRKYVKNLHLSEKAQIEKNTVKEFFFGLFVVIIYGMYVVAFYIGVNIIINPLDNMTVKHLILTFFCMKLALIATLQIKTYFRIYLAAKNAAKKIYRIVKQKSIIVLDKNVLTAEEQRTEFLVFENVTFSYPSRPNRQAIISCSFDIQPGEHVVFTGPSGSGKSTIMRLLHRFYDPQFGRILLDETVLKDLDIRWLRGKIGFVGENPVLTGDTYYECISAETNLKDVLEVVKVAKITGIDSFIGQNKNHYNTAISKSLTLAQKQKLAIARVLLRQPSIIILDQATTALTRREELQLYSEMYKIQNLTIITVTSRLSLMKHADVIFCMVRGVILEFGTFDSLIKKNGYFGGIVDRTSIYMTNDDPHDIISDFEPINSEKDSKISPLSLFKIKQTPFRQEFSEYEVINLYMYQGTMFVNNAVAMPEISMLHPEQPKQWHFSKILRLNSPEWPYLIIASMAAMLIGFSFPAYAILFGECLGLVAINQTEDVKKNRILFYTNLFIIAAVVTGITIWIEGYMKSIASAKLTTRLRKMLLKAMLFYEFSWFDYTVKDMLTLCNILRVDAANAQTLSGEQLTDILTAVCGITISVLMGAYYNWVLGFGVLLIMPFLLLSFYLHSSMLIKHSMIEQEKLYKAKQVAERAIVNIQSIASMNQESYFLSEYEKNLNNAYQDIMAKATKRAIIYGLSMAMPYFAYSATMYYGAYLINASSIQFSDLYKVSESLILGTILLAQLITFVPALVHDRFSAATILNVLYKPKPDPRNIIFPMYLGSINFKNVCYINSEVPNLAQLKEFSYTFVEGYRIGMVGTPSSGYEVPIPLFLRFYSPTNGIISVNEVCIDAIYLPDFYRQIGLINIDGIFTNRTIAENIAYGNLKKSFRMDDVVCAAKEANVHDFIITLKEAYDTVMMQDNPKLTISQRIRISLARALYHEASILIFEEMCKCESSEAEEMVRRAIDNVSAGRIIIISSPDLLSCVQEMDQILFFQDSVLNDYGNHSELLSRNKLYHRLYSRQMYNSEYLQVSDDEI